MQLQVRESSERLQSLIFLILIKFLRKTKQDKKLIKINLQDT